MTSPDRLIPLCLAFLSVLWTAPALLEAETPVDESCAASADGRVEVEILAGKLKVLGWNEDRIAVTGTAGDEIEELILECGSGRSEIRSRLVERDGQSWTEKSTTHLEIWIPRGSSFESETVSASVSVADLTGEVTLESVSGALKIQGVPTALEVDSVSGEVHVAEAIPSLSVESVSGEIRVDSLGGPAEVSSVSGDVHVRGVAEDLTLESVSGSIHFEGDVASGGRLEAESHSGNVALHLPSSVSAELRASSFSGSISNSLGGLEADSRGPGEGSSLHQTLGGGGARIEVETFSGTIELAGN